MGKFSQFCSKGFTASSIHVLCVNFVKFGEPKIGKLVCCLPDKKKQIFSSLFRSGFCPYRVQNLPGSAADNVLRVPQISSKSFISGGVIAERGNTVETRDKVFQYSAEA